MTQPLTLTFDRTPFYPSRHLPAGTCVPASNFVLAIMAQNTNIVVAGGTEAGTHTASGFNSS
jgi:hypothetical protein